MQASTTAEVNNLLLKDINIFSFDIEGKRLSVASPNASVWIAISSFELVSNKHTIANNPSKRSNSSKPSISHQLQKQAVRKLLYNLVSQLLNHCQFYYVELKAINLFSTRGLNLHQSNYPYRLLPFNYYLCFTHSADKVACAVNKHRPIGIDIENHSVSLPVAQRFYDDREIEWLSSIEVKLQPKALKLLWMLKEAAIKIDFTDNNHLLSGLKTNMLLPATQLLPFNANKTATDSKSRNNKLLVDKNTKTNLELKVFTFKQLIYLHLVNNNLVAVW